MAQNLKADKSIQWKLGPLSTPGSFPPPQRPPAFPVSWLHSMFLLRVSVHLILETIPYQYMKNFPTSVNGRGALLRRKALPAMCPLAVSPQVFSGFCSHCHSCLSMHIILHVCRYPQEKLWDGDRWAESTGIFNFIKSCTSPTAVRALLTNFSLKYINSKSAQYGQWKYNVSLTNMCKGQ